MWKYFSHKENLKTIKKILSETEGVSWEMNKLLNRTLNTLHGSHVERMREKEQDVDMGKCRVYNKKSDYWEK